MILRLKLKKFHPGNLNSPNADCYQFVCGNPIASQVSWIELPFLSGQTFVKTIALMIIAQFEKDKRQPRALHTIDEVMSQLRAYVRIWRMACIQATLPEAPSGYPPLSITLFVFLIYMFILITISTVSYGTSKAEWQA